MENKFIERYCCVSCGNLYRTNELTQEKFEELADHEDADVSVENGVDVLNMKGTCKSCLEDYYEHDPEDV